MKFRKLKAAEIKAEKASVNKGGVKVLLWKKKFAVSDILDEQVSPENWTATYSNENRNCTISVKTDSGVITRTGVGDKPTPKALADDAMSCAGTMLGIGRELYTAPEIFFFKDDLPDYKYDETSGEAPSCSNDFKVLDIQYAEDVISSVTIGVMKYGKLISKHVFNADVAKPEPSAVPKADTPVQFKGNEEKINDSANAAHEHVDAKPASKEVPAPEAEKEGFADDEIILIGNCRGMKYSSAKGTTRFTSFLKWINAPERANLSYEDPAKDSQVKRFRKIG